MDFKNILTKLDQLNEGVEVVAEKAVSQAQQKAAGAALSAKRGDTPKSELTGASKEMLDMSEKDLEDFASTKHKGIPKKKEESFDSSAFRKSFEAMVEAKGKMPDFPDVDGDGNKKEPIEQAQKDAKEKGGKEESGKKGMTDKQKKYFGKKDESVEEGKSPHKKGSAKYKKQMAAKHASMAESINESFEKFIGNEKMSFDEMIAVVQESGGQQKIDPVDNVLWQWANRVASSKGESEMYAAKIYESNGGRFELHDVLSED